jgi:hypothetical protein
MNIKEINEEFKKFISEEPLEEQFDPSKSLYSQHPFPIDKQVKKYKRKKEDVKGNVNKKQAKADYDRLKFASRGIEK